MGQDWKDRSTLALVRRSSKRPKVCLGSASCHTMGCRQEATSADMGRIEKQAQQSSSPSHSRGPRFLAPDTDLGCRPHVLSDSWLKLEPLPCSEGQGGVSYQHHLRGPLASSVPWREVLGLRHDCGVDAQGKCCVCSVSCSQELGICVPGGHRCDASPRASHLFSLARTSRNKDLQLPWVRSHC